MTLESVRSIEDLAAALRLAQVPTPVMHPVELLSLFIHRLRW